jgi:hypothetical protein
MASKYTALSSEVSLLTTQLNSLANAALCAASSAIDNDTASTHRDPLCVLELSLAVQGTARSAGAAVEVFFLPTEDGTDHTAEVAGCVENNLVAVLYLDEAVTARKIVRAGVPLPPTDFKVMVRNSTGQAFNASGNELVMKRYGMEDVSA